jgi:Domain of unknown function (DUF4390)
MTVSSTPCLARPDAWRRLWVALLLALVGSLPCAVRSDSTVTPLDVKLELNNEVYSLTGSYRIELSSALREVLDSGVPLTFSVEFEVLRPRKWWWDEDIAEVRRTVKIQYNVLLKQYALFLGSKQKTFDDVRQALDAAGSLDAWQVLDKRLLKARHDYTARVRMRLDTSQLPKPLQVNTLASSRWDLDSGWLEWALKP